MALVLQDKWKKEICGSCNLCRLTDHFDGNHFDWDGLGLSLKSGDNSKCSKNPKIVASVFNLLN